MTNEYLRPLLWQSARVASVLPRERPSAKECSTHLEEREDDSPAEAGR